MKVLQTVLMVSEAITLLWLWEQINMMILKMPIIR